MWCVVYNLLIILSKYISTYIGNILHITQSLICYVRLYIDVLSATQALIY